MELKERCTQWMKDVITAHRDLGYEDDCDAIVDAKYMLVLLEKSTPVEPTESAFGTCCCPKCGMPLEDIPDWKKYTYCSGCGQCIEIK